jgi:hypothetical protein
MHAWISSALTSSQFSFSTAMSQKWEQCTLVSIMSHYRLDDWGFNLCIQTGSGAHPVGTKGPFPRGKMRLGRDSDHSSSPSANVKKVGAIPSYFLFH